MLGSGCAGAFEAVPRPPVPQRFPLRTIILMILALASFVWFYWNMHQPRRSQASQVQEVHVLGGDR